MLIVALGPTTGAAQGLPQEAGMPEVESLRGPDVQRGDWVIDTQYHHGCDRHRWCRWRQWRPDENRHVYSGCYWGGCAVPNGSFGGYGGYGGHEGRGY